MANVGLPIYNGRCYCLPRCRRYPLRRAERRLLDRLDAQLSRERSRLGTASTHWRTGRLVGKVADL